jgi:glycosyltransferase involved in cell wall biosynthesis
MKASVSLVIPCRDDAVLLRVALESAYDQTRAFDEVIVVDNASSDDTAAVARSFGARVIREESLGVTAAAAAGFDAAKGTIIARCDADSQLPREWAASILAALDEAPAVLGVTGPANFSGFGPLRNLLARALYLQPYFLFHRHLLRHEVLFGSNCAVRASAWHALSPSVPRNDPLLHDDLDLSLRLARGGPVLYRRDILVQVSPRPVQAPLSLIRRLRRALHTYRTVRGSMARRVRAHA